ncbi:hypothetical protein ACFLVR_04205 [Chloroflexota bacterium]
MLIEESDTIIYIGWEIESRLLDMNIVTIVVLSIVLPILIGLLGIYITLKVKKRKWIFWSFKTVRMFEINKGDDSLPQISLDGKIVNEIYRTEVLFVNKGNETIRNGDITKKITVDLGDNVILQKPRISQMSNPENRIALDTTEENKSFVEVDFYYLDPDDGALFEVIHSKKDKVELTANIMGVNKIKHIFGWFNMNYIWRSQGNILGIVFGVVTPIVMIVAAQLLKPPITMELVGSYIVIGILFGSFFGKSLYYSTVPYILAQTTPKWCKRIETEYENYKFTM